MRLQLSAFAICLILLGCKSGSNSMNAEKADSKLEDVSEAKNLSLDFKTETEKWKTELLLNGEVGPPCKSDFQKWTEENPNYYWGMQKIDSLLYDFNGDGIKDALLFFPAENCVGGNGSGSDFGMLVYSHNNQTLTNKNITKIIESKLKDALAENGISDVFDVNFNYKTFTKSIGGSYFAWNGGDPHCCPSSKGTFEYNPIKFSMEIKNTIEK